MARLVNVAGPGATLECRAYCGMLALTLEISEIPFSRSERNQWYYFYAGFESKQRKGAHQDMTPSAKDFVIESFPPWLRK